MTSYAIAGVPAVKVLFQRGQQVTWDNLYQLFYRPFGLGGPLGSDNVPGWVFPLALALFIGVALLAFFRLPDRVPGLPAVTPALALSLAWIFFWPFQRPWYDVMIIALLALYPSSGLDVVVLVRLCFGAVTYMEAARVRTPLVPARAVLRGRLDHVDRPAARSRGADLDVRHRPLGQQTRRAVRPTCTRRSCSLI